MVGATETWLYYANLIKTIGIGVTAFVGLATLLATIFANKWQTELSAAKDEAFLIFKTEAQERISATEGETARSKERTASLEKAAEDLRNENLKLTERLAWRSLPQPTEPAKIAPKDQSQQPELTQKMLVITLGDAEAQKFGAQIITALQSVGVNVIQFQIGTFSPPPYGVQALPNSMNPAALAALEKIHVTLSETPLGFLPIPVSIRAQYQGVPTILVGLRSPP